MVSQAELESAIRQKVDRVSALVVSDVSGGCGQAYDVIIVSEAFEGLNTLKRHRMVNELLKEQIAQLHAFSQKTYTPQQYEQMSGKSDEATDVASGAAVAAAAAAAAGSGAGSPVTPTKLTTALPPAARPSTLDTSVAQRGAKVHHRSTSSNVSVPELILTPDAGDAKRGGSHGRQRSLTPNTLNDLVEGGSPGGGGNSSSVSRLHYNQITSVEFWAELRELLERRFTHDDGSASPGAAAAAASTGRKRGETEMVTVFEDFFQTQKKHMSASDAARVRDGTGMFGM